ncbi:MAG: asparagine synthase (glutamine-hydrolyzing) [Alphaproteobacteria bacterium]|nr:asparagine synthase (glutamine-hydrolyzing) [Alphaproteobacteria bacterium]
MCGIVGAFGPSVRSLKGQCQIAVAALSHRGPDAEGSWFSEDGFCFLGHRRLTILDSSVAAAQPMVDKESALVYNGEIYNHQSLRNQSVVFKTHSDTETLFYLLKESHRKNILKQLDGMFVGSYYEKEKKSLFLFRDALGIKPLYWSSMQDGTVLFSSEVKGILSLLPPYLPKVEKTVLKTYLTFENWPQNKSLFSGIHLLLPGQSLLLTMASDGNVSQKLEQWQSSRETSIQHQGASLSKNYDECVQHVRKAIEKTIKNHLLSDVPVSAYLSGGLDSGTIVAVASQYKKDLLAFTGYYDVKDNWYDEREFARKTAERYQVSQIEVPITPEDFILSFDNLIRILEEPRMGMGSFSQMIVSKKASEYRKVILAGHGGDELFLGYPLLKACLILEKFPRLSSLKGLCSLNQKEWPWLLNLLFEKLRGKIYLAPRLWSNSPFEILSNNESETTFNAFLTSNLSTSMKALEAYYINTYLPGLLLVEDKISMAFSLETRTPLWSPDFINQIQNISAEVKLSQGRLKGLFKDAVSFWLPPEIINAPKRGFPTPFRYWFRKELRTEVERRLLREGDCLDPLISKENRKKLLQSHFNKKLPFALDERRAHRIWMLLSLESWARQFQVQWGII